MCCSGRRTRYREFVYEFTLSDIIARRTAIVNRFEADIVTSCTNYALNRFYFRLVRVSSWHNYRVLPDVGRFYVVKGANFVPYGTKTPPKETPQRQD